MSFLQCLAVPHRPAAIGGCIINWKLLAWCFIALTTKWQHYFEGVLTPILVRYSLSANLSPPSTPTATLLLGVWTMNIHITAYVLTWRNAWHDCITFSFDRISCLLIRELYAVHRADWSFASVRVQLWFPIRIRNWPGNLHARHGHSESGILIHIFIICYIH